MRKINKKGAEYTTSTIIVIVLALLVLVVLAMGFGAGWSNLWSKITGFFSPVNVDSVKLACQYACTTQSVDAFCCQDRDVRFVKGEKPVPLKCTADKIKPTDCSLDCPADACQTASGTLFDSEAFAASDCSVLCDDINRMSTPTGKAAICNELVSYKTAGQTITVQCNKLGSCVAKCK